MSWLLRGRELIFGAYKHLPTLFIVGSLLVGSITGIVPILILGLVCSFLGLIVYGFQSIMRNLFTNNASVLALLSSQNQDMPKEILLSMWVTMTTFIVIYIFSNALAVFLLPPVANADDERYSNRRSYMMSVMISVLIVGLILLLSRMTNLGNETYIMGISSLILGTGIGFAMWNLVSVGGKDLRIGDIFQVRNNMTSISTSGVTTPIMCTT